MAESQLLSGNLETEAWVSALQLCGEGGILGAGVGHVCHGRNRNHALGKGVGWKSSAALVARHRHRNSLLRGDPGDAGDCRLALLSSLSGSGCLSHELGVVGWEDDGASLSRRARTRPCNPEKRVNRRGRHEGKGKRDTGDRGQEWRLIRLHRPGWNHGTSCGCCYAIRSAWQAWP